MNILQLCTSPDNETNIGIILKKCGHKIIDKYSFENVSLVSYDAIIIMVSFLNNRIEEIEGIYEKISSLNKPVIYVYNSNMDVKTSGLLFLSKKYNIKFQLSDCEILDTKGWSYMPEVFGWCGEAISMNSKHCNGYCNVKNTKFYYIMQTEDAIIMHDIELKYIDRKSHLIDIRNISDLVDLCLQQNKVVSAEDVNWLKNINVFDEDNLNLQLDELESEIEKILKKKEKIKKELNENEYYKGVLYLSGSKLVEIVKRILEEMLDVSYDGDDIKKEDLYFKLDKINVLFEVKGVNRAFHRRDISQARNHVNDYAQKHEIYGADVNKLCKGVLIINPYVLSDLNDKISKEFYSKEVIADANYHNICTLDTLTLLTYYSKWRKDKNLIDMKNILLNTNYNKPDYDEIIRKTS